MPMAAVDVDAGGIPVRISSPGKLYFPQLGLTKLDIVHYVLAVGEGMLAALRGRPTTLERWPNGVIPEAKLVSRGDAEGDAFYQKRAPAKLPGFVETATVHFPSGRAAVEITPTTLASLVWLVNLGTLRFHPWPVSAPDTEHVDQLRIDLDPQPGSTFNDARRAAHEARAILADAGLTAFCKTSGGRGLHLFCRIEPVDFIEARHAAIAVGRELARRVPDQVSVNWWKEERGERIFVDFNQMARDRLMASAYSIRPGPRALVSAPLAWDELDAIHPSDFTVLTMPACYAEHGDRWRALYRESPASIAAALAWYERDAARGEGEMPYPPEYPKMPGEPSRVQPSRARKTGD